MKVHLTTRDVLRLAEALQTLDRTTPEGGNVYKVAGTVRMAMAKNMNELDKVIRAYQKARNQLVYDHGDGTNQVSADKLAAFEQAHAEMLEASHSLDLIRLTEPLLQLDVNDFPVTALAAFMLIMKDEAPSAQLAAA